MYKILRRLIFSRLVLLRIGSFKTSPVVNGYTRLNRNTHLGFNTNFNGLIVYGGGKVKIGDNFHCGQGCKLITQSHNYDGDSVPYDSTYKTFNIVIENNVWLGMGVTVIGNVTIGEGAIVQVGSVVVSDIPKFAIAGGHPAKVFSMRDSAKYADLVSKKKYN